MYWPHSHLIVSLPKYHIILHVTDKVIFLVRIWGWPLSVMGFFSALEKFGQYGDREPANQMTGKHLVTPGVETSDKCT
jgi:hypothetical protein